MERAGLGGRIGAIQGFGTKSARVRARWFDCRRHQTKAALSIAIAASAAIDTAPAEPGAALAVSVEPVAAEAMVDEAAWPDDELRHAGPSRHGFLRQCRHVVPFVGRPRLAGRSGGRGTAESSPAKAPGGRAGSENLGRHQEQGLRALELAAKIVRRHCRACRESHRAPLGRASSQAARRSYRFSHPSHRLPPLSPGGARGCRHRQALTTSPTRSRWTSRAPHTMAPIGGEPSETPFTAKTYSQPKTYKKKHTAHIKTSPRIILDGWRLPST